MSRFREAILEHYGLKGGREPSSVQQLWIDYAMSTNDRGVIVVDSVESFLGPLKGKRWLDIGSGYGGLAVAAGLRGAITIGVEHDPKLVRISNENLADHDGLQVTFVNADIHQAGSLPEGERWDVISLDNVIEHVDRPFQVYQRITELLAPDGIVYMAAPNGRSLSQIRSDGHFQLFGISLLDPPDGAAYLNEAMADAAYDVSWMHRRSEYFGMAKMVGLDVILINGQRTLRETEKSLTDLTGSLRNDFPELIETVPEVVRETVRYLVEEILDDCEASIAYSKRLEGHRRESFLREMQREYLDEVFYLVMRWPEGKAPWPKPLPAVPGLIRKCFRHMRPLPGSRP